MEIDIKKWNDWANRSSFLFSGIKDNRKIGILIDSIEDKLIILTKKENGIDVSLLNDVEEVDDKTADLILEIKEDDVEKVINDENFSKFLELTASDEIKMYDLVGIKKLIRLGYEAFLSRISYNVNNTDTCCCCC
ncbi:hypothetical protein [uncultured Methanobrevibacter sp.]|uniref:hypothetical protein n=1 Tax=uncultured Methanobrevibacter sp. TaxID=253161 RepID=UPI0025861D81|nr:hypothetical protein [uncultured Methanobrevibacter sp.]